MSIQLIALLANIGLAVMKFTVGYLSGSRALVADAFNSAGDVVATFVAWLAFRYARTPADENHPYGHGNAETLAGLLIGAVLSATGAFIAIDSLLAILEEEIKEAPGELALWAAGITAVVKEGLYRVSIREGRRSGSPTLLASARDHRADVFLGLGAMLGVYLSREFLPALDAITGALIGVYVFWLGIEPIRNNVGILMHEAPPDLKDVVREHACRHVQAESITAVRVQPLGGSYRVDMSLGVDPTMPVREAHRVALEVEASILREMPRVLEVHVQIEPFGQAQ